MIKYRSALNSNGELVNIDQIKRDENEGKEKYRCLSCGNELITKLGDVKIHHFAHKQTINCNGETYLHELGKKIFYNEYTACLRNKTPFSLEFYRKKICNLGESEFGRKCYINLELVPFDLTLYFNEIQIEKKDGDFIPDLKLSQKSGKEVIYIEIAVTHLSTEKKLNSQNRIVEIKVNDERDLDVIKQHKLSIKQSKILFKNFEIKKTEGNFCNGNCQCSFDIFLVYQSGKVVLLTKSLSEISNMLKRLDQKIIYQHLSRYVEGSEYKFKYLIAKAYNENVFFKNCYICRYHGETRDSFDVIDTLENKGKPIFCKTHKKNCNSNDATGCDRFRAEQEYINFHLQAGENIMTLANSDEPHEDYYTENQYALKQEFREKLKSSEIY